MQQRPRGTLSRTVGALKIRVWSIEGGLILLENRQPRSRYRTPPTSKWITTSGCPQTLADDIGSKKGKPITPPKEAMAVATWNKWEVPNEFLRLVISSWTIRTRRGSSKTSSRRRRQGKAEEAEVGGEEAATRFIPTNHRGGSDPDPAGNKP